ncbi:hypothetical protein [Agriterribacter sp.]|uniref:hypothetical protein n=1 Tax=Agriterribacter sp. TaxID=2821509 RepID=UPI002B6F4FC5|nr:hypothetical protein [Agriterribacter sp.]HRP57422.1 hypothetical protein [Agriterribacter sp.]
MSCCGKKRAALNAEYYRPSPAANHPKENAGTSAGTVQIEYTGNAGFSITGSRTGKRYSFNRKSEVLTVDPQDEAGLLMYPYLQRKNR